MQYFVSFTLYLDSDVEHSESEIKDYMIESLDNAGSSVENIQVELVKNI